MHCNWVTQISNIIMLDFSKYVNAFTGKKEVIYTNHEGPGHIICQGCKKGHPWWLQSQG